MSWLFGLSSAPAPAPPPSTPSKPLSTMARRERTDEGPTFTSQKCPPGPGLENSCELPYGFIWTPLADIPKRRPRPTEDPIEAKEQADAKVAAISNAIPIIDCPTSSLPPVLCLTCLAYLNPHVEIKYKTGVWNCALCGSENVLPKKYLGPDGLLIPALSANMVEYHQPLPPPPPNKEGDMCTVVLVVDANLDPSDAKGIFKAVEQVFLDLMDDEGEEDEDGMASHPEIQVGLVVFDQAVALYQLGITGVASADIYTLEDDDDEARENALESRPYLQSISSKADLDSLSQCLSAVFGVSVEESSSSGEAKSSSRMEMLRQKKEARQRQEQLKQQQQGREAASIDFPTESPWIQKRTAKKSIKSQSRCTGEALQCAMDLSSVQESRTSRILLFTNGCPNIGDGSVVAETDEAPEKPLPQMAASKKKKKHDVVDGGQMSRAIDFYDTLAGLAVEAGIFVDVFCAGAMELGLPAYQALVEPSGGYVLPHSIFDSPQLVHNMTYCLKYTYPSRTTSEIPVGKADDEEPPRRGLGRFFGRGKKALKDEEDGAKGRAECVVDIRTDSFVVPTHLVGSGELVDSTSSKNGKSRLMRNERSAFAEGSKLAANKGIKTNNLPSAEALNLSLTRLRLARVDPLATLSVMAQVNETMVPEEDEHAFFQTTVRYISRNGKSMITRVCTHRFEVAKSVSDFVKHADDEVVSVLLAKGAVYRSLHGREETEDTKDKVVAGDPETLEQLAYDAQLDLDATVQRISGAFRLLGLEESTKNLDLESGREEKKLSSPSSLDFAFPPQLREGLGRLYHLRRGALISPGPMRSMDDRAEVRQLFLRFPLQDCVGMMAPNLWSTGNLENVRNPSSVSSLNPFPAETLALWDASIIAADHHDVQFVWSGKACAEPDPFDLVREKFKKYLKTKATDRFPMPEIHMLFDGDSMSRRFTTLLAPSHADSPEQQVANFPELATLSPRALERLRSRFRFYDAASDASFRKWFWSVSSATHASREDGMSLCE